MGAFILLIFYATNQNWTPVTQEFSNEANCQAALKQIQQVYDERSASRAVKLICVQK
jgi:hypothetical protein